MKKMFYLIVLISQGVFAQGKIELDTIFANDFHNVSLFFPSPVRQGIVGASNFTFSFNEDSPQHFGLLKATSGNDSSLLVVTQDGQIYSYLLKYRADIPKLHHFIARTESIGNEVPRDSVTTFTESKDALSKDEVPEETITKVSYFNNLSAYYLHNATGSLKAKRKYKLKLTVKELAYYRNETYMIFELENKSGIDFELNYLNVYLTQGSRKRNASFQKILIDPLYKHEFPEVIKDQQRRKFVYVLPKFTLGDNERVEVEVREKKGNRNLKLGFKGH